MTDRPTAVNIPGGPHPAPTAFRPTTGTADAPVDLESARRWRLLEQLVAIGLMLILGYRYTLPQDFTLGGLVAMALLPLWWGLALRYKAGKLLLGLGALCLAVGPLLTSLSSADHPTSTGKIISATALMITLLGGAGAILWCRTVLRDGTVIALFGVGMLAGVSSGTSLFGSNPWRFGFSIPITIIALGLLRLAARRWLSLVVLGALIAASGLSDARSSFAMLLLTALVVGWQALPRTRSRRASAARVLLALGVLSFSIYTLGQALILEGFLGESTQVRSQAQLDASGSLIVGGRPELAATMALMSDNPWGYGSGTSPNAHDLTVAKQGMIAINYDPENGYVERYMFGSGYELHSIFGDLWSDYGIAGICLVLAVLGLTLLRLSQSIARRVADAAVVYLCIRTLWNLAFSPFYSSIPLLMLFTGVILLQTPREVVEMSRTDDAPEVPIEAAAPLPETAARPARRRVGAT
ncbi:hypothetical protein GIS00_02195 [Nakamurella sp. YIM 132087]|uniref:O-antigen ligase domain-containing protein n=1 Tax=Nakamurella alba TaxID=2665158 RepID=A0A7K1FF60_9ACTN|nr:O-antigen polymerase [Nakamurella alba]MTD12755.1 hypothetical protein [Nakamurella alba]